MRGRWVAYTPEELAWLEANCTLPVADYAAGLKALSGRDLKPQALHARRKRRGWKTGRTGYFPKGGEPMNKGKKFGPGKGANHPNAVRTQFKPGVRQGRAAERWKPVGTERLGHDGYLERKVNEDMPFKNRWKAVHRINWEAVHGPVPEGHALKCLGDKADTRAENWVLVPRALLPRLAGGPHGQIVPFDAAPAEMKPALLTLARLDHKARSMRRQKGAGHG